MKLSIVGCVAVCIWASVGAAKDTVREFSWSELKKTSQLTVGEIEVGPGQHEQLKIDNPKNEPMTVTLLDFDNPGITSFHYGIEGRVRCENVQGKSYLEMWSWFADGNRYYSRTLGESGPMQHLEGTSDWRPFALPFFGNAESGLPTRIVVNAVLVDRGTVYLSPITLCQFPDGWWTERDAGWIGGVGGSIVGLLGALIGTLGGFGKARRFVLLLTTALVGLGVLCLILGAAAFALGQPYAVYYPLLLFGIITTAVCGGNLPILRRRYQQIELRRMTAMDSR